MLNFELDIVDEKHEEAATWIASYKQQSAKYYNKNFRTRTFQTGDWVLRKVFQNTKETGVGKLGVNWERLYKITPIIGNGVYKLHSQNRRHIDNSWNAVHLCRYYV